jgi:hypothetical protein
MSDRAAPADATESSGTPDQRAEQVASLIFAAIRADLGLLHAEVVGLRSVTTGVQEELALLAHKADVHTVSTEAAQVREEVVNLRGAMQAMERRIDARIERLDATVKAQPNAIMLRLGALMVVLTGVILAALRYLPPPHG